MPVKCDHQELAAEQDEEDGVLNLVEIGPEMVEIVVSNLMRGKGADQNAESKCRCDGLNCHVLSFVFNEPTYDQRLKWPIARWISRG